MDKLRMILIIGSIICMPYGVYAIEVSDKEPVTKSVSKGFEDAMQKLDAQKEAERNKLTSQLKGKLDNAVEEWIASQKKKRSLELNTIVEQHWENLTEFGPRIHRNYYLRDFSYKIISTDIIKTESMTGAYKAVMHVTEKLFAERYHSPDVSYPEDYYYTVTTPIKVNFDYYGEKFVVTGVEAAKAEIVQGWRR